jgi:excisionase family DNA binding protein
MQTTADDTKTLLLDIVARLDRIEKRSITKEAWTIEEAANRIGKSAYTVRQWANLGCIRATKVRGKGRRGEWRIADAEVARVQAEGASSDGSFANGAAVSRRDG